jgi:hypothetical protein
VAGKRVELHPEAQRELDDAADWYDERAGNGHKLTAAVREAGRRIGAAPALLAGTPPVGHGVKERPKRERAPEQKAPEPRKLFSAEEGT